MSILYTSHLYTYIIWIHLKHIIWFFLFWGFCNLCGAPAWDHALDIGKVMKEIQIRLARIKVWLWQGPLLRDPWGRRGIAGSTVSAAQIFDGLLADPKSYSSWPNTYSWVSNHYRDSRDATTSTLFFCMWLWHTSYILFLSPDCCRAGGLRGPKGVRWGVVSHRWGQQVEMDNLYHGTELGGQTIWTSIQHLFRYSGCALTHSRNLAMFNFNNWWIKQHNATARWFIAKDLSSPLAVISHGLLAYSLKPGTLASCEQGSEHLQSFLLGCIQKHGLSQGLFPRVFWRSQGNRGPSGPQGWRKHCRATAWIHEVGPHWWDLWSNGGKAGGGF